MFSVNSRNFLSKKFSPVKKLFLTLRLEKQAGLSLLLKNAKEESPGNKEQPPFLTGRWPRGYVKCRRKQPPVKGKGEKAG